MRKCEKCVEREGVKKGVLITLGALAGLAGLVSAGLLLFRKLRDDLSGMWVVSGDEDWGFDDEDFEDEDLYGEEEDADEAPAADEAEPEKAE